MTCWDEARPANACYAPMAREMALEAAAAASENPASHTMVSSRIFRLTVNGALWGEFEMYAHAAAYRGVPTLFASGDEGMCAAAAHTVPGLLTVPTKSGHGYGVLIKTPELVRLEIEGMMAKAVVTAKTATPPALPDHFPVEVTYVHHYDAYGCAHDPGASLISPTTVAFDADDYGDVLCFFYFVI